LLLERLEDRLVPSIPDGTLLVCTGPSLFASTDQSSFPIGIVGVDPNAGAQFPVSVNSSQDGNLFTTPTYVIEGPDGQLYVTDSQAFDTGAIIRVDPNTGQQFLVTKGQYINGPNTLAWVNGFLYVANEADGSGTVHTIVQVDPNSGAQVLITDGSSGTGFTVPVGMVPGPNNNIYVADEPGGYNGSQPGGVWEVNLTTGQQTLITWGNLIDHPVDMTQDLNGNLIVIGTAVADTSVQQAPIVRVNPADPDPDGSNQTLIYTEGVGIPLDGITVDLNTGIIYTGSISYGTNPAELFAVNPTTQTQTTVTTGRDLSLLESIGVYHPVIQPAALRTPIAPSINPSTFGQSAAFTATVSPQTSGSGTLQLTSGLTVTGTFTNSAGTFDANDQPVTVSGPATLAGGTYLAGMAPQTFSSGLSIMGGSFTSSTGPMTVTGGVTLSGGQLSGVGTVDVLMASGGTVAPGGTSPGVLTISGAVAFNATSTFSILVNGTSAGTDYSQLQAGGPIVLGGSTLSLNLGFTPPVGSSFEILTNTGATPIPDTFAGLAEGAVFSQGSSQFQITYQGGTGGDSVVLTCVA
jgi:sugar lactone lactonase YvrE